MFQNPYMPNYYNNNFNQQSMNDRIDNQIAQLNQMKEQINKPMQQPVPTNLTQNFQLAPQNNNGLKIVSNVEEVQKELAIVETPFVNKDYSTLWIKNAKGQIRTFALEEIIPKDEKDILIENLQSQINNLSTQIKEMNYNEQYYAKSNDESRDEYESEQFVEPTKSSKSPNVSSNRTSKSKSK